MRGLLQLLAVLAAFLGTFALALSMVAPVAYAQSPIYIRQDGGYVGKALDGIDCHGSGVTCSRSGARLKIEGGAGGSDARGHWLLAILSAGYTTPAASDHIKFDVVAASDGTDCALDTASAYTVANNVASMGRFTLAGDGTKQFLLRFEPGYWTWSSGAGMAQLAWVNADTGAAVGSGSILAPTTGTSNLLSNGVFSAVVTPSASTRYEVKVMFQGGTSTVGGTSTGPDAGVFKLHPQAWCERLK